MNAFLRFLRFLIFLPFAYLFYVRLSRKVFDIDQWLSHLDASSWSTQFFTGSLIWIISLWAVIGYSFLGFYIAPTRSLLVRAALLIPLIANGALNAFILVLVVFGNLDDSAARNLSGAISPRWGYGLATVATLYGTVYCLMLRDENEKLLFFSTDEEIDSKKRKMLSSFLLRTVPGSLLMGVLASIIATIIMRLFGY
jgi:hypothetical protein